jgi:hypothetical protein
MTLAISLDRERDLVVARASDKQSAREIIDIFSTAIRETKGEALHKDVLFILHKDVLLHQIDLKALQEIRDCVEEWVAVYPGRSVRTGFVVPDTINKVAVKLWQSMTQSFPGIGAQVRIFSRESDALAWLQERAGAPSAQ